MSFEIASFYNITINPSFYKLIPSYLKGVSEKKTENFSFPVPLSPCLYALLMIYFLYVIPRLITTGFFCESIG